jgi:signal transduction histidine kinase/CheY-like chemotaxis protein
MKEVNDTSQLLDLVNKAPAVIFKYEIKGSSDDLRFTAVSEGMKTLFDINPQEVVRNHSVLFDLLSDDDADTLRKTLCSKDGLNKDWQLKLVFINKNNEKNWMQISGRLTLSEKKTAEGYAVISPINEIDKALIESGLKLESLNKLHDLIINFSTILAQARVEGVDDAVNTTLSRLGEYAEVDRVYIFEHVDEGNFTNNTFEWCGEGIQPEIENLQGIPYEFVPRWKEKFDRNEYVYIPLISEIAPEYTVEKQILEPQGIISLLAIPMFYGDKFFGFIGFDSVKRQREWSEEHIALLRLAGEIIAGTLNRARFEQEIILARKKAEEANKAKSEFLATMSHEIRTPMNAILGFSEILINTTTNDKHRNYLSAVLTSGKTLLSLINDILDLSKIESGQMEISKEPVQIKTVFDEIMQVFQARAAEKSLSLQIDLADDFPEMLMLDDVRLRQVLFNLVGNAVKFTQKGEIIISASFKKSEILENHVDIIIKVTDSGIGIPEDMLDKIFQSFFQIESDNTRKYGGTGLGLPISQKLVQIMGGKLLAESKLNVGSTFILELNDVEITVEEVNKEKHFDWEGKKVHFKGSTVLIVDDVDFNRELVKSFLNDFNLTIIEAKNGSEGVEICKIHQPDLVLMDLRMPGMNGYEATEILTNLDETNHIPIVAFTASSMKHDETLIRKLFHEYLRKPISRNELINMLTQFLPFEILEASTISLTEDEQNEIVESLNPIQAEGFLNEFDIELREQLESLKMFMDLDLLEKFLSNMDFLVRQFAIHDLKATLSKLKQDKENFDFEHFHLHIHQLSEKITLLNAKKN